MKAPLEAVAFEVSFPSVAVLENNPERGQICFQTDRHHVSLLMTRADLERLQYEIGAKLKAKPRPARKARTSNSSANRSK